MIDKLFKKNELFRKQAVFNITSPEKIGLLIKTSSPSIVIMILATAFFIVGFTIWGMFYKIDTIIPVGAICKNGSTECFLNEADFEKLKKTKNLHINIKNKTYPVEKISAIPERILTSNFSYAMHKSHLKPGDWAFKINLKTENLENGIFIGFLIANKVAPISFVFN